MQHVRQEDPAGCVCASLAMVTGRSYATVKLDPLFRGVDWSVGITHQSAEMYLALTGFASGLVYRWLPGIIDGKQPQIERWPPEPFAPSHIVSINGGRHNVVWLPDGTVLDPMQEAPRRLDDCGDVAYVLGIWRVTPWTVAMKNEDEKVPPDVDLIDYNRTAENLGLTRLDLAPVPTPATDQEIDS
jgi:hypothetical protein